MLPIHWAILGIKMHTGVSYTEHLNALLSFPHRKKKREIKGQRDYLKKFAKNFPNLGKKIDI